MRRLQQVWRFVLSEPFTWLYRYFFKTNIFMSEVEIKDRATRLKLLLRLMLPMFLVSYPLALILSLIGTAISGNFHLDTYLLLKTAVGLLSGFLVGAAWDAVMNRPVGILGGMWLGIWLGMWAAISWSLWIAILLATVGGIALGSGVVKSIGKITAKSLEGSMRSLEDLEFSIDEVIISNKEKLEATYIIIGICILYLIGVVAPNIEQNKARKIGVVVAVCAVVSAIGFVVSFVISSIGGDSWRITWPIWWAVTMGSLAGILAGVTLSHIRNKLADWGVGIGSGIVIGDMLGNFQQPTVPAIIVAITPAIVTAIVWSITIITLYRGTGVASKIRKTNLLIFSAGMALGIIAGHLTGGAWVIILFPLCYIISYCQLPLWLLSSISIETAAVASGKNPSEVFVQLRASSLYWDEWEVLPLLDLRYLTSETGLHTMMRLAAEQDIEQALEVLTFIETERPLQFEAARSGASEGFSKLIDRERENLEAQSDLSGVIQQFTRWQALVSKLHMSDSPRRLARLEEKRLARLEEKMESAAETGLLRGFLQLVAREMEPQKTLRDISETGEQFTKLQALSTRLNIFDSDGDEPLPSLDTLFACLKDVCLDADRYLKALGWQARHDALQDMLIKLRTISELISMPAPDMPERSAYDYLFSDPEEDQREGYKQAVVANWKKITQYKLSELEQEPRKTDQINNPYVAGPVLQLGTSLFKGRQDLGQQLEQGLERRSTFFLTGERRMGKSSALLQLPLLLGTHFLSIYFDLQGPAMTSSIAAFLSTIAEKMSKALESEGMQVAPLADLQEAQRKNERSVYHAFDEWLKQVEQVLEQNDRVVLLSFDEFEELETAGKDKYLDLDLLFKWFRSVIQNRPRLALLFSGGKSVREMDQETGLNWSDYFVNVQTLKVSFLQEKYARELITQPIRDYPIEQIFGTGVVDEIVRVTSCQPFLVQAVCSSLVDNLNADDRTRAEIQDVAVAVTQVLKDWEDAYFHNLWTRSDPEQQACLRALSELGKSNIQQIAQYIYRNKEFMREASQNVQRALQILLKRDLVSLENETYQLAIPIFSRWVEQRVGSNS